MTGKTQDLTIQEPTALTPLKDEAERLIELALTKKADVETMERLLMMRRELKAERAKEEFDRAMASFQAKCPTIQKTKQGYNYKYAALETIVEQVKELLADNGFSYTFDTDEVDNAVVVTCKVKHIAGHMESSKATITRETTSKMNASQQSGAAMTYGKRYAFINAFGILTGDEDTDAAAPKEEKSFTPRQMAEKKEADTDVLARVCAVCEVVLPENVYLYSVNHYRKPLCFTHQKQAKEDLEAEGESHRDVS